MIQLNVVAPVQQAVVTSSANATTADAPGALLPPARSGVDLNDAMAAMLAIESKLRDVRSHAGEKQIKAAHDSQREAIKREAAAKQREREAEADRGGGFFSAVSHVARTYVKDAVSLRAENLAAPGIGAFVKDMATDPALARDFNRMFSSSTMRWVAVGLSVAACVGTGGAAAPLILAIAGAVLTSASATEDQFHYLESAGVSTKTARWVSVGMAVGGAGCTAGAGILSKADGWGRVVKATSEITSGTCAVGEGAGTIAVAHFDKLADDAHADALEQRHRAAQLRRLIEAIVESLKEDNDSHNKKVQHVQKAVETNSATLVSVTSMKV